MMVVVMVYAMICYNVSLALDGVSNQVFIIALHELPIMAPIALIIEMLLVGRLAKNITFKLVNPSKVEPIVITIMISSLTVAFMCPIMSFIATILIKKVSLNLVFATWIQTTAMNFPMAFFFQIFYAGPLVRFIFRTIFKNQLNK